MRVRVFSLHNENPTLRRERTSLCYIWVVVAKRSNAVHCHLSGVCVRLLY